MKKRKRNSRHMKFVEEYLVDLNASQAAIRAGYKSKNASEVACRLLKRPDISEALQSRRLDLQQRTRITQERVLLEYARLAFVDPRSIFEWGPDGIIIKDSNELSEDEAACIAEATELRTDKGVNTKIKLHDKKGALDSLARHLGLFEKDNKQKGIDGEFWSRLIASVPESRSLPSSREKLE